MFADYCLSCGKELDDERAYCNEFCQSGDLTSSEASSPFASPSNAPQDVPALVPSALGRALRAYTAHDRYSASSSSASSTAWSVVTDDDDDDSEFDIDLSPDARHRPNALSYARRPSGTNNPHPRRHCRTASSSSSLVCAAFPQSAPGDAPSFRFLDDDDESDVPSEPAIPPVPTITPTSSKLTKHQRKRNRASLPTYFSMLQINNSPAAASSPSSPGAGPPMYTSTPSPPEMTTASPVSCSSGRTVAALVNVAGRPSPPTPKLTLLAHAHAAQHPSRGRTCTPSRSRSPSPSRRRDSDEKVADWSRRGRASVRRNSSSGAASGAPPFYDGCEQASPRAVAGSGSGEAWERDRDASRSREWSRERERERERDETLRRRSGARGRARVEELEGPGSPAHPGYGFGRSGLLARAHGHGHVGRVGR
ncbi:hypothetical protein C8R45DRAFT_1092161 [Mycena sanguinolenta]|nr:hypothetical protein C8R45DRAFT_1092161 [Mycena sanguinolenta]